MMTREDITEQIKLLIKPHLYASGYNKHLDPKRGLFGPKSPLMIYHDKDITEFDGYVLQEMLAISEDGPITDGFGGGCIITDFSDLPIEDLELLRDWAVREFLPSSDPTTKRDQPAVGR